MLLNTTHDMESPIPTISRISCSICGRSDAPRAANIPGPRTGRHFHIRYCEPCGFAWVEEAWADFATIYDEAYYLGKGSDPSVNYVDELHNSNTIRQWEWQGILHWADSMRPAGAGRLRWLDFGCGNGGLVRHVRAHASARWEIEGMEEGWAANYGREHGIPILTRDEALESHRKGSYDLITAIEVLEHTVDPRETLREIRSLLRPGGQFIYTTGNLTPHTRNFAGWSYVSPEIHVSYYEPRALARLLKETGFEPRFMGYQQSHTAITGYKVLKNLKMKTLRPWMYALPWPVLGRLLHYKVQIFEHPVATAV